MRELRSFEIVLALGYGVFDCSQYGVVAFWGLSIGSIRLGPKYPYEEPYSMTQGPEPKRTNLKGTKENSLNGRGSKCINSTSLEP